VERGIGIVQRLTGADYEASLTLLEDSNGSVPIALVMHKTGENRRDAEKRLKKAGNNLRKAIG
jgi:N-acetylmuramic acid 6-phosphate (MurNAc-6-P) etherase